MATLSSALNYALAGLSASAAQSAVVSRNVGNAANPNYSRKVAELYTLPGGAPAVAAYQRSTEKQLLDKLLTANSGASSSQVLADALARMSATAGDPQDDGSLAAVMANVQQALRTSEANPADGALAANAVEQARSFAVKLNDVGDTAAGIRSEADQAMAGSVDRINTLLAQFKIVNDGIVRGTGTVDDLTDSLDQRDGILKSLSEEIGIRTVTRANNDVMIYADGGAVLFEGSPRSVTMAAGAPEPGARGNAVFIDGVAVTGTSAAMPVKSGRIAALADVRDGIGLDFQTQLDSMAAGLVRAFAEEDQTGSGAPAVQGLFVDPAGGVPVAGATPPGLASRLSLNALADPDQGGSPFLVRDGGFGGANYIYNSAALPGYQARLTQLADAFDTPAMLGTAQGGTAVAALKSFAVDLTSWVEGQRQSVQTRSDSTSAVQARARESLLRVTGVSVDDEMAALLDLEKSYQASSKIMSIVDGMLATLFEAVR